MDENTRNLCVERLMQTFPETGMTRQYAEDMIDNFITDEDPFNSAQNYILQNGNSVGDDDNENNNEKNDNSGINGNAENENIGLGTVPLQGNGSGAVPPQASEVNLGQTGGVGGMGMSVGGMGPGIPGFMAMSGAMGGGGMPVWAMGGGIVPPPANDFGAVPPPAMGANLGQTGFMGMSGVMGGGGMPVWGIGGGIPSSYQGASSGVGREERNDGDDKKKKKGNEKECSQCNQVFTSDKLYSCDKANGIHLVCADCIKTSINSALAGDADNKRQCAISNCQNSYSMEMLEGIIPFAVIKKLHKAEEPPPAPVPVPAPVPAPVPQPFPPQNYPPPNPWGAVPVPVPVSRSQGGFTAPQPIPSNQSEIKPPTKRLELTNPLGQNRCFSDMCPYCARPVKRIQLDPTVRLDCRICKISFILDLGKVQFVEKPYQSSEL